MGLDRFDAEVELRGNLFGFQAFADEPEDPKLTRGEAGGFWLEIGAGKMDKHLMSRQILKLCSRWKPVSAGLLAFDL